MTTIVIQKLCKGEDGGMGRVKLYSGDTVVSDTPFYGKVTSEYRKKLMPDPPAFDRVEFAAEEGVTFEGHVEE